MSHAIQFTSTDENEEEFVWPEYKPSPAHRNFLEHLKRARIERGLSIPDMAEEVGLGLRLAHEFENLVTPLPFSHLELWCQAVGVPFADYLAIYWADERDWAEREAARKEAGQNSPCITNTEADATEATALSPSPRAFSWLSLLRSLIAHIRNRFFSLFYTPE